MDHVAIMRKSWGLLPKILSREKKIESRWYKNKPVFWEKINQGDTIFFKNSGELITVKVKVKGVERFENLNPDKIKGLLNTYGREIGIEDLDKYLEMLKNKKYCLLMFLDKPKKIKPFGVNKKGYGAMSAWMCVKKIDLIKLP
jgi:ASC-1-like (ASCH) protein